MAWINHAYIHPTLLQQDIFNAAHVATCAAKMQSCSALEILGINPRAGLQQPLHYILATLAGSLRTLLNQLDHRGERSFVSTYLVNCPLSLAISLFDTGTIVQQHLSPIISRAVDSHVVWHHTLTISS